MLTLRFFQNSRGVWVGELLEAGTRMLATTHPATIAAAIFAMDEYRLRVETNAGSFEMKFPFDTDEQVQLGRLVQDAQMGEWLSLFCTFSRFDFAHPAPNDTRADIHFRTAVHHLPQELVKVYPSGPEPRDFKQQ
ncbi:hypothetical protein PQR65_37370 [Paraburkholderia nemoris]|uniref:hypothetical protein n=1 Tax=Paraburkholderia nemoris TaxID=2793076 RepID=UPI0038B9202B